MKHWCFQMRSFNEVQLISTAKAIIAGPDKNKIKTIEPSTGMLEDKRRMFGRR